MGCARRPGLISADQHRGSYFLNFVCRDLAELGEPLLSSTLLLPGDELPLNDAREIRDRVERDVDLVLDSGSCGVTPTTVVDLTGEYPVITRQGRGVLAPFGL